MFYYIANVQNNTFEVLRQCSEEEYSRIKKLQEPLSTILYRVNRRIEPLQKAFKRISTINIALMKQTNEYDRYDLSDAVSNFLFRFRKHLDNWETYLKRECADVPERYKAFKEATSQAYDSHIEYQLIYHLRNVDQHCDNIISGLQLGISEDGATYIEATAKCKYLLSVSDDWKPNEKELLQEHEEIDLYKYLSVAYRCIQEIHQTILNTFFSMDLYDNCYKIVGLSNEFHDKREHLKIFCQEEELTEEYFRRPRKTLNMEDWMVKECINLLKIYLKKNMPVAVVLYHGSISCEFIDEFAINLDKQEKKCDININEMIKVENWNYLCTSKKIDVIKDLYTVIAINKALSKEQQLDMKDRIKRFVDVLVWKEHLENEEYP